VKAPYIIIPGTIGHKDGKSAHVRLHPNDWYGFARVTNPICGEGDDHVYVHPDGSWKDHAHWFGTEEEVLAAIAKATT